LVNLYEIATSELIRRAEDSAGGDSPIDRYKVRLLVARAEKTTGISSGDRLALLRKAYEQAEQNTRRHPDDKMSYIELCNVGLKIADRSGNIHIFDESIKALRDAEEGLLDPDIGQHLQSFERHRRRLSR
jgi:hypothetical protein